jgi:MipA family protein
MRRGGIAASLRAAVSSLLLVPAAYGHADTLPRWEAGLGLGVLGVPDYRGSDVRHSYVLPAPYIVYRGDILKADRSGVRAALFERDRLAINLSLNATPARSSGDNPTRQGMTALRPTVEIGPTADVLLWQASGGRASLHLRAPVRAAITVESSPRHIGWLFSPNLNLNLRGTPGLPGWKLGMQVGPVFADRRYHRYFYSVDAADARPGRPAYTAPGGYSGAQFTATLSKRFARYWIGAYLRQDHLRNASFASSPLVQRHSATTAGVAVAWVFGTSSSTVDVPAQDESPD